MPKLYELTEQYRALQALLDDGVTENDLIQKTIEECHDIIETKIENIGKLILSMEADATSIRTEEQRLASRRQSLEKQVDHLKTYLLNEMVTCQLEKVKKATITISLRTNPPSVNVLDLEAIPQEYRRVIPESWQVDKVAILTQFKTTGEIINGTAIITDRKSISIK